MLDQDLLKGDMCKDKRDMLSTFTETSEEFYINMDHWRRKEYEQPFYDQGVKQNSNEQIKNLKQIYQMTI